MELKKIVAILGVMAVIIFCVGSFVSEMFGDESNSLVEEKEQVVAENIDSKPTTTMEVHKEVYFLVGALHKNLNKSLGYSRIRNFKSAEQMKEYYDRELIALIERLDKVNKETPSLNLYKDLWNIIHLGEILESGKGDTRTLKYLHRITHDLDAFVLNNTPVKEYWKVIHTGKSSDVEDIEEHICDKLDLKIKDYRIQAEKNFNENIYMS